MQGVPSAESSRSVRGLGKGVSGKPYPRLCNARRPRLEPGTFRSQAVLCHVLPSLEKLRKEGLDGHEKLKGYIWWLSLCFATVAAFTVSCYSLQYSVYAASYRTWFIFDYLCWNFDWLHRYTTQVDNSVFRNESTPVTEVEPYIPFNINPTGMQPLLTTSYLLAFPSIMASIFASPFWENLREILNLKTSTGGSPWVYFSTYAFLVFIFNIFDIANLPKEISDYLNKMSARVPRIKPGRATVDYLTKIQTSSRFWGGINY